MSGRKGVLKGLVALVVSLCAVGLAGCSIGTDDKKAAELAAREAAERIGSGGRSADDLPIPPPPPPPLTPLEIAAADAQASARQLSEETSLSLNKSRKRYCNLLQVYESQGGSYGAFVPWAMDEIGIRTPTPIYIEQTLEGLEEAVIEAENGNVLGALVSAVCV